MNSCSASDIQMLSIILRVLPTKNPICIALPGATLLKPVDGGGKYAGVKSQKAHVWILPMASCVTLGNVSPSLNLNVLIANFR